MGRDPSSSDSDAWPAVLALGTDEQPWIAFRTADGDRMDSWLHTHDGSVSEIQALNVVMQIAVKLHSAHGFGIPHGRLGEETVVLRNTSGGLEEVELVGWAPVPEGEYEAAYQADLKALGNCSIDSSRAYSLHLRKLQKMKNSKGIRLVPLTMFSWIGSMKIAI